MSCLPPFPRAYTLYIYVRGLLRRQGFSDTGFIVQLLLIFQSDLETPVIESST